VWAFGVILYYFVTRKFPFEATKDKTIDEVVNETTIELEDLKKI